MTNLPIFTEVLEFWFAPRVQPLWFAATPEFDAEVRTRFQGLWRQAAQQGLAGWMDGAESALALVIVLDQFPLNMYRGLPESFATEAAARTLSRVAIDRGHDRVIQSARRGFFYLPFMHSESLADQDESVGLYRAAGLTESVRWAEHHRAIIRRFGRFPHRNAILGRASSPAEQAYLASPEAFQG